MFLREFDLQKFKKLKIMFWIDLSVGKFVHDVKNT
jgi:hypothetical protein